MIFVVLALWLQVPNLDELLAKTCDGRTPHAATADEKAIIAVVAQHYRKAETSVEDRRRRDYIVTADYARHAVASQKAPQVFFLDSLTLPVVPEASLRLEMQRHGVPGALADRLIAQLKKQNAARVEWSRPDKLIPISCREMYGLSLMRPPPAGRDFTNLATALAFALPAFDDAKQYAAVLSINDIEAFLKGKWGNLELSLLKRVGAGKWQQEWDTPLSFRRGDPAAPAETLRPSDSAIFDAVLARLGGTARVVNQTRGVPMFDSNLATFPAAAVADLRSRGNASIYLGSYAPPRGQLVQRETADLLVAAREPGSGPATVWFALPGYDGDTAVAVYTITRRNDRGWEQGVVTALLERTGGVWRVQRDDFRLLMKTP